MYNLKITAASSSAGLKLRKNSWYFAKVSPGENATLESLLTVAKDAESAENTLTFTFEYEDSKGTASTGTETLNLTVTQPVSGTQKAPFSGGSLCLGHGRTHRKSAEFKPDEGL